MILWTECPNCGNKFDVECDECKTDIRRLTSSPYGWLTISCDQPTPHQWEMEARALRELVLKLLPEQSGDPVNYPYQPDEG